MVNRLLWSVFLILAATANVQAQSATIKSPDEFLPYPFGSRFTPHHLLVDYFEYVDQVSDKIKLVQYGKTYEFRPLIAAIISSPENLKRLETIRLNNLRRTGMITGQPVADDIAIVYLSYSVHGNEAAGSESAMAVLYDLVKGDIEISGWLKNTIVIIDPALNPDGYERYSQWSNSISNHPFNPSPNTREHDEPWPGGRFNHYYFDLNRDWAWQSQQESRERLAFYHQWMPHVHADLHEMSMESPYYFAPAAQPYHPNVSEWQADFQTIIGKNHAYHFDKEGWRYFTRERFDLYYPSYGDTYPTFAGAIGMTYEQGGSRLANRAVRLKNGDTLTLADRIAHHRTSSLSTIEICSKNASKLVQEFATYFEKSMADAPGNVRSYVIKKDYFPGRVADLLLLLDRNKITYGRMSDSISDVAAYNYLTGEQDIFTALAGDIIIPAEQPRGVLLHVLFDTKTQLTDTLTYDITAWCLPMAYGLEAYATETVIPYQSFEQEFSQIIPVDKKPFAYALSWGSVAASRALAGLLKEGIVARYATSAFTIRGTSYPEGTVLLMRGDNRKNPQFDAIIKRESENALTLFSPISTGFADRGQDLGSDDYKLIRKPKVMTFSGEGVSPVGIGEAWHFFEEELHYPIHIIDIQSIRDAALDDYNVILLTDGIYTLEDEMTEKLNKWVNGGGRLVAIGSAINKLESKGGFSIKSITSGVPEFSGPDDPVHVPEAYAAMQRNSLSDEMPGTIFQTSIDHSHPLSFGLGEAYWTLKTSSTNYAWMADRGNAVYLDDSPDYLGWAGYKALENTRKTLIAGRQDMGSGSVVYLADNPLFRSFWNSGKVLFSNSLFF